MRSCHSKAIVDKDGVIDHAVRINFNLCPQGEQVVYYLAVVF